MEEKNYSKYLREFYLRKQTNALHKETPIEEIHNEKNIAPEKIIEIHKEETAEEVPSITSQFNFGVDVNVAKEKLEPKEEAPPITSQFNFGTREITEDVVEEVPDDVPNLFDEYEKKEKKKLKDKNKKKEEIVELKKKKGIFNIVIIALIISFVLSIFVIQLRQVSGNSMVPTLEDGDVCVVSKVYSWFLNPKYNDIVVIDSRVDRKHTSIDEISDVFKNNFIASIFTKSAPDKHIYWVKRIVGLPGDRIQFEDGKLKRNGEIIEELYTKELYIVPNPIIDIVVGDNMVFVMGDNRNDSKDSRSVGQIPFSNIIGKSLFSF